jgi:hypothetical protein
LTKGHKSTDPSIASTKRVCQHTFDRTWREAKADRKKEKTSRKGCMKRAIACQTFSLTLLYFIWLM